MHSIGLISIIMAAYNAERTITQAIESVIKQSYQNWELIIVNDCSTDGTADQINKCEDPRIIKLENTTNMGVFQTRLRATTEARGEWIAVLDSDDAWTPDKLEKQVEHQKKTNANLIFTGSAFMKADGSPLAWILHIPERISYRQLLKQNLISNSSVLVRKHLYKTYQIPGSNIHEDYACWLGCLRAGEIAFGIDEPLLIYRLSEQSKTGNKLRSAKMNWNTYRATGLSLLASAWYMVFYTVNGLIKYRMIKTHK